MVNPAVLPGRGPISYLWTDEYVKEIIRDFIRSARSSGLWDVRGETKRATFAADAVVRCADDWQVDYIIVGASHRSALMQVLGGSVSREIALRANCPVLIAAQVGAPIDHTKHTSRIGWFAH
jgi:nucleotide-binding universal stress UspA family protein